MKERKKSIFISYDGITDPLGQSQILPYLIGLSEKGHQISILSCEKKQNFKINKELVEAKLEAANIKWKYTFYTNKPPIISTFFLIRKIKSLAFKMFAKTDFDVIHCRSIIPAMIGKSLQNQFGGKLVFDIRGFWADERVEGKLWNLKNPLFLLIYRYFKRKEKMLFQHVDYIISLTENAKKYIEDHFRTNHKFQVIPCSVDVDHFNPQNLDHELIQSVRKKWKLAETDFVLTYVGSLGTRYMLKEMLLFFKALKLKKPNSKFLFISKSDTTEIKSICEAEKIDFNSIIITSCEYSEIPNYLSIGQVSIFFIVSTFSGKAVSPTKQSEVLSLGIPIIANSNLGDTETILKRTGVGIVQEEFSNEAYKRTVEKLLNYKKPASEIREVAIEYFSLKKAIEKYHEVYQNL